VAEGCATGGSGAVELDPLVSRAAEGSVQRGASRNDALGLGAPGNAQNHEGGGGHELRNARGR
jgi:hypothetical protein